MINEKSKLDGGNSENISMNETIDKYLKEFYKLPVLYSFNGFDVRDINKLDTNLHFIDKFIFDFSDEFFLWFQNIEDDNGFREKITEKNYSYPLDKYGIMEKLSSVANIEDFGQYNENEIFAKYPIRTNDILNNCKNFFNIYYSHWTAVVPDYFADKSFFISWYSQEMSLLPWKDWKEIEEVISKK